MEELLKSISARLRAAVNLIDDGELEGARSLLTGLDSILPEPEERHVEAASSGS